MHSLCFNPAENCARVHALQDGRLVHWHHLSLGVAGYAPANSFSGTADEQDAFSLNGDLGSLFLHACLSAVMNAAEVSGCPYVVALASASAYNLPRLDSALTL